MLNAHPPARLPIRTKRRLSEEGRRTRPKPGKEKNRWYVDLATAYFYPGLLGTWIKMDNMLMMLSWMTMSNGEQSLMQNQDQTLNLISGTLNTLHGQASLMGREVYDQNGFVLPPPRPSSSLSPSSSFPLSLRLRFFFVSAIGTPPTD
jgi:hypothetical protein